MFKHCSAIFCGLFFGTGLAVADMNNPLKVLAFLDIFGEWDASLMLVLGGAVGITALFTRTILHRKKPLLDDRFHTPIATAIDKPLIMGSALFGIGWGIGGYCPGPAIAMLASPNMETLAFLPAMVIGWLAYNIKND
jgi:uncharacterized membrane protein YedE/YeeE